MGKRQKKSIFSAIYILKCRGFLPAGGHRALPRDSQATTGTLDIGTHRSGQATVRLVNPFITGRKRGREAPARQILDVTRFG